MKRTITIVLVILGIMSFISCNLFGQRIRGNGNVIKETRETQRFEGISASSGINVYLFQSDETKVLIEADENLMECISTKVKNNTLQCSIDCSITGSNTINIYVSTPSVNNLSASSSASIFGETLIVTDNLNLKASSSADIKIELQANNVNCVASSSADIVLIGSCTNFKAKASSSADIKAKNLNTINADLTASSASDIHISVSEALKASASSASDIVFYGSPDYLSIKESSGSKIKQQQ